MSTLLPCVEHETGPRPTHSVIWMHGLGADGHDFAPIVPELVRPDWPALRFVFPHAPVRPVTINGGTPMRAWYDIRGFDPHDSIDAIGIRVSIQAIEALIAREHERGVSSERLLLAGFSQGGVIALETGLRYRERLAGIIALSTYLPLAAALVHEHSAANADTPIFQAHGTLDTVVVPARGQEAQQVLHTLGHRVDWHSYTMAHAVCAEEIADLSRWMGLRLR